MAHLTRLKRVVALLFLLAGCSVAPSMPATEVATSVVETAVSLPTAATTSAPAYPPINSTASAATEAPAQYSYQVVNSYPHDPDAFTQGLVYLDGELYEGTGLNGQSSLRRTKLETGVVEQIIPLDPQYFGEGVTVFDDKIYQLTWKSQTGFIYDLESFEQLDTFSYATEGWGLTHNGRQLIMSDGSNTLYFLEPDTLAVTGSVAVFDQATPVMRLNELEYINGEIFANVWQTNLIARIDPETGQVTGWLDLTGLLPPEALTQPVDVLNGIAHDGENGRLFVTGKLWPLLFEIELVETAVTTPYP